VCTCSFARRDLAPAGSIPVHEGIEHLIEEARWQKTVIVTVAVRQLAQIVAWPDKFIAFGDYNPGRVVVESEMPLYWQRDLYR
jgi:hypothetical protein